MESIVIPLQNVVQIDAWSYSVNDSLSFVPQRRSQLSITVSQSISTFQGYFVDWVQTSLIHQWLWPHTHTHTRLTALFPGLPGWAGTRKIKPVWILLKKETVSGSGISWAICKSASRSRQITMPVPPPLSFLPAGCPSCCPTNSVKALKAWLWPQ